MLRISIRYLPYTLPNDGTSNAVNSDLYVPPKTIAGPNRGAYHLWGKLCLQAVD